VRLTASTLIENDDDENDDDRIVMRTQDIESLRVGDYVEIEGRERTSDGGYLEAIKIEHDDGEDRYEMEGRVTAVTSDSVTVLGLAMLGGSVDLSGFQVGDQVDVEYSRNVGGDYVVFGIEEDD
jgi:uncharacterized OB-fold protein